MPLSREIMQEAADLADKTFQHILNHIKPGVKESDIALEMEMFMRKEWCNFVVI